MLGKEYCGKKVTVVRINPLIENEFLHKIHQIGIYPQQEIEVIKYQNKILHIKVNNIEYAINIDQAKYIEVRYVVS
ncbi:hypothetical protein P344_01630 [Spiroplasma mirum ATCC 29335]|uniref:Ferrous iron transporter FeoA-like domain-containing protein n=1 Tax=Spiroplasma mirum ATCC 29335 TaxID=838561 RepID=W6AVH2_9MOLU|nr:MULTISPECIES: FeoA family protein [Spiroplasma]AHI57689.1 hypothetical protein P344_01630 [Spiroplasma mirum ATCC 29335]AKM52835.1 hypothetical protein SATRI_v1c03080 [Spiroplasma atrichopogonis]